ncbi:putative fluoride ion transporter CrcB [Agromyces rhizosphaerae]|uniref:Fluoride-specific ion channel FluC n=1 Tax=Agromyces rhizosphaerae TaxID=88374 RepID=A0A9W6CVK1_9MICO|nr:putative fluoride ion transporter CrcB [Agromyces rhizosphaerae]
MTHRPVHLRPSTVALVAAGGAVGTALREGATLAFPDRGDFPLTLLIVNVLGAFALGMLLEVLLRLGPDAGRRRAIRLSVGTGVLGGFTTYSAFAVGTVELLQAGLVGLALLNALGTVVLGAAATFAGIIAAGTLVRRRDAEATA